MCDLAPLLGPARLWIGTLFVYTEERGTTGIRYAHEPIHTEPADDETEEEYCPQRTLDAWLGGTA